MKKILLSLFSLLLLAGCEREKTTPMTTQTIRDMESLSPTRKIDICHYSEEDNTWHLLEISTYAWSAHQSHGDKMLIDADGDGWVAAVNECVPGGDCDDNDADVNPGYSEDCVVDCVVSEWSEWSECVVSSCGQGIQTRTRTILIPASNGGLECPPLTETRPCERPLEVTVDPDGTAESGDEYTLFVYPRNNSDAIAWGAVGDVPGLAYYFPDLSDAYSDFDGEANTAKIVEANNDWNNGNYAARLCADLSNEWGSDWYLPSAGELKAIEEQLGPEGSNCIEGEYWTSNHYTEFTAIVKPITSPVLSNVGKEVPTIGCRCVRK